jgi:hypothetical protein
MEIQHAVTGDSLDGQPWPPLGDGWVIVRRIPGFTLWRSIQIAQSHSPPADFANLFGRQSQSQMKGH